MSQVTVDAGFAGTGKFVGPLIVRLAQRYISGAVCQFSVTQCLSH